MARRANSPAPSSLKQRHASPKVRRTTSVPDRSHAAPRKSGSKGDLGDDFGGGIAEELQEMTDRAESRVGMLQVSGRYHRLPRTIEADYDVTPTVLGAGYNGEVYAATSTSNPGLKFAVKKFKFSGVPEEKRQQLKSEVEVFLSIDHPNIARLVDVYENGEHLDLVMECMNGGELFDRMVQLKRLSEFDAAHATWQMLLALNYIHIHGIAHCDVKLENFMYDAPVGAGGGSENHLKLIDFGFSKMCSRQEALHMKTCGTLSYLAPEVLNGIFTTQCDLWSLGVIAFVLLSGYMPFQGKDRELMTNVLRGHYQMREKRWSSISEEAKSFVKSLLIVDPHRRLTAQSALGHPFIEKRHFNSKVEVDNSIVQALRDFGRMSRFRRACMSMMAWSLSSEERNSVEQYFNALDETHQGAIHKDELKRLMVGRFRLSANEFERVFSALDMHHDHEVHYSDFLAAMVQSRIALNDMLTQSAFRKFDPDDTGYITKDSLQKVLGESFEGTRVENLIQEADILRDGRVSYHEFVAYMNGWPMHLHGDEGIADESTLANAPTRTCLGSLGACGAGKGEIIRKLSSGSIRPSTSRQRAHTTSCTVH